MNIQSNETIRNDRSGFTILEVLIALTASLLLMLGLTRAYKLLGDRITERQSELELSSKLRDVALRLRDELERATCEMTPPASESAGEGYLVYHEGPFTSATTVLGSTPHPAPFSTGFFRDSRFGDMDDYLAFTARAEEDAPFIGFIPQGVLMAHRFANGQMNAAEIQQFGHDDATRLVPFYSDFAEIVYWASPRYSRNADGSLVYAGDTPTTTQPVFRDRDGDLLPDRLDLHRRVLLIRPDLNMTVADMYVANVTMSGRFSTLNVSAYNPSTPYVPDDIPTIPFLTRDSSGNIYIQPLSYGQGTQGNPDFYPSNLTNAPAAGDPRLNAPGIWWNPADGTNLDQPAPSWLTGLARMQQVMDLSISREPVDWTSLTESSLPYSRTQTFLTPPAGPTEQVAYRGMPSVVVRANNLSLLTRPENRFGFVRIPEPLVSGFGGGNGLSSSSMPQLALCPPHPYLESRFTTPPTPPVGVPLSEHLPPPPWPTTFPAQADDPRLTLAPGNIDFENPFGRFTMTTFLRPEFALADRISDQGANLRAAGESVAIINRGGSDVIATDLVSFDVQIFDPNAPTFIWEGPNGVPGAVGDDDGDGDSFDDTRAATSGIIELEELGVVGTDDEFTPVTSLRIDEALIDNGTRQQNGGFDFSNSPRRSRFGVVDRGAFVDLNYMRLAGGPMRGLLQSDIASGNVLPLDNLAAFESPFSGIQLPVVTIGANTFVPFPDGYEDSGRFILRRGGAAPVISSFYQPMYDTWTDGYAMDPFDQEGANPASGNFVREPLNGAGAVAGTYTERRVRQDNSAGSPQTTNMRQMDVLQLSYRRWTSIPRAVSNTGEFAAQSAGVLQNAPTSATAFRATPPVAEPLRAIKVTIRVNDFDAETIRQQTVIQEF